MTRLIPSALARGFTLAAWTSIFRGLAHHGRNVLGFLIPTSRKVP